MGFWVYLFWGMWREETLRGFGGEEKHIWRWVMVGSKYVSNWIAEGIYEERGGGGRKEEGREGEVKYKLKGCLSFEHFFFWFLFCMNFFSCFLLLSLYVWNAIWFDVVGWVLSILGAVGRFRKWSWSAEGTDTGTPLWIVAHPSSDTSTLPSEQEDTETSLLYSQRANRMITKKSLRVC
jgi:hypothetical protein